MRKTKFVINLDGREVPIMVKFEGLFKRPTHWLDGENIGPTPTIKQLREGHTYTTKNGSKLFIQSQNLPGNMFAHKFTATFNGVPIAKTPFSSNVFQVSQGYMWLGIISCFYFLLVIGNGLAASSPPSVPINKSVIYLLLFAACYLIFFAWGYKKNLFLPIALATITAAVDALFNPTFLIDIGERKRYKLLVFKMMIFWWLFKGARDAYQLLKNNDKPKPT